MSTAFKRIIVWEHFVFLNSVYTLLVEGLWGESKQNCIFNSIYSPLPWLRLILFFGHFRPIWGFEKLVFNSTPPKCKIISKNLLYHYKVSSLALMNLHSFWERSHFSLKYFSWILRSQSSIWKHTTCVTRVFFSSIANFQCFFSF